MCGVIWGGKNVLNLTSGDCGTTLKILKALNSTFSMGEFYDM